MEDKIREEFPDADVELIDSSGGAFEVEKDGELIFSKNETGRHPEWEEIRAALAG